MIDNFSGTYAFLSNFHPVVGRLSVEHLFQAAKTTDPEIANTILAAETAGQAKRLGRRIPFRHYRNDWDDVRYSAMEGALTWKFMIPEFREMILSTGSQYLREGNYWHDAHWGVCWGTSVPGGRCTKHSRPEGANILGLMLMELRDKLR